MGPRIFTGDMMTNAEIDIRLRTLADYLPKLADNRKANGVDQVHTELELMNMQLIALTAMLGEIAKRLPVPKTD